MITVGRIIRPHHNRGHVVLMPETDFPHERFAVGSVLCRERDGTVEPIVVSANREREGQWVVGFEGFGSINDAETLRGVDLRIPAARRQAAWTGRSLRVRPGRLRGADARRGSGRAG